MLPSLPSPLLLPLQLALSTISGQRPDLFLLPLQRLLPPPLLLPLQPLHIPVRHSPLPGRGRAQPSCSGIEHPYLSTALLLLLLLPPHSLRPMRPPHIPMLHSSLQGRGSAQPSCGGIERTCLPTVRLPGVAASACTPPAAAPAPAAATAACHLPRPLSPPPSPPAWQY